MTDFFYSIKQIHSEKDFCDFSEFEEFCDKCDCYEPFCEDDSMCDIIMFAAYVDSELAGFLSMLRIENSEPYELTALVLPEYRRRGIFSGLLAEAKKYISDDVVCAVPKELLSSGFVERHAYDEYLMKHSVEKLLCDEAFDISSDDTVFSDMEYCFSDDLRVFMLYKNEDAKEPCALLNLDYQDSFTVIYGVFVDSDIRNKGIGTILMNDFMFEYYKENSLPLVLNVRSTNASAVALYKKCGFSIESHISYYYII